MTKKQTSQAQALAVLLMMFHHYFLSPEKCAGFTPISENVLLRAAWFSKIAINLFAFISGYGLYASLSKCNQSSTGSFLKEAFPKILSRIFSLYIKVWIALLLCKGIDFAFLHQTVFDWKECILNILCIQTTYDGSYWYVQQYIAMLLLTPPVLLILQKDSKVLVKILSFLCFGAGIVLFRFIGWLQLIIFILYLMGILFKAFCLYEKVEKVKFFAHPLTSLLLMILVIIVRVLLAKDHTFMKGDVLFAPIVVYAFPRLTLFVKPLHFVLEKVGKHNTYMWLTHLTVYILTLNIGRTIIHYPVLYFLCSTTLTLFVAILLDILEKLLRKPFTKKER